MQKHPLQVLILAGGTGTRLWPASRQNSPKQFQTLVGRKTLFQLAVTRAKKITKTSNIFVATNSKFTKTVCKQAPQIPKKNIISEPAFRDTATCLGYAATVLESRNPGGVMAVIYADHLIQDEDELSRKIRAAAEVARSEKLAIVEIKSEYPATQLGWVQVKRSKKSEVRSQKACPPKPWRRRVLGEEVLELKRFVEKPNLENAKKFHASKDYFWNTGLYVWRTDILLDKFCLHLPGTFKRLKRISSNLENKKIIEKEYSACQKISIDYGIMEKVPTKEVAILPAKLGWSDVGTWGSLKNELSSDTKNLIEADHVGIETQGCLVRGTKKKLIATVGLENLVIVDTDDALLICSRDKSGDVKKIVERLAERKKLL